MVDQGGHEGERGRGQELRKAVGRRPVRPVEHLLKDLPTISSEGWHSGHHREKRAPAWIFSSKTRVARGGVGGRPWEKGVLLRGNFGANVSSEKERGEAGEDAGRDAVFVALLLS